MSRRLWAWASLAATLALLVLSAVAHADGKYFGAIAAEPTTPHQRGLIAYRDGVLTLIVESTLNAPPGSYTWVIPVPSEPISVEPVGAGALETAVLLLSPVVARPPTGLFLILAMVWLTVVGFAFRAFAKNFRARTYIVEVVLMIVGFGLAALFFFPVFAGMSSPSLPDVEGDWTRIGSYEVSKIAPSGGEEAVQAIRAGGAHVPDSAKGAIEDYAREGWSFVLARLAKEGRGMAAPHPLQVRFRTDKPVYPMRLTLSKGETLTLQLVVIGDLRAEAEGLQVWTCAQNEVRSNHRRLTSWKTGEKVNRPLNHPDIAEFLGPDSVLTFLRGELSGDTPPSDISIRWVPFEREQRVLYSAQGKRWRMANGALLLWSLGIFVGVSLGLHRRVGSNRSLMWGFAWGAVPALLYVAYLGLTVQTAEPGKLGRSHFGRQFSWLQNELQTLAWHKGSDFDGVLQASPERARAALAEIPRRDVPGGYTVRREGEEWVVSLYDADGTAWTRRIRISSSASP